jgi:predicted amidohydrolase YtcJ
MVDPDDRRGMTPMTEAVLFAGGPIRLMSEPDLAADMPEALLVEGGRVRAIGSRSEVRAAARSAAREVDLDGRTLMPGFVDAHTHTLLHGSGVDWVDLSDAESLDDVVQRLRRRAEQDPTGPVRGYGYDQNKLAERRHPLAVDLDRVTTERPVQIQHASGHGYAVNTVVLQESGITAGTATPEGGRIDRDDAGDPVGVVFDAACDLLTGAGGVKVSNHGPNFHLPMPEQEVSRLFQLGQRSFLAAGITTICDAQVTELEMAAYLRERDAGRLQVRAHLMYLSSKLEQLRGLGIVSRLGDDRLELHGVKLYADGSVIARTAYLGESACCGRPAPQGYLYHEPEELTELITTAHELGLRTATHAQGELPIGLVLDAVREGRSRRPRPGLRHRIEHCGFPRDDQVQQMAQLGVVPVPQPMQVHLYGDSLMEEYGDYGGRFYPYGSFERHGLPVVISSDAPVTMPAPLRAAWAAVTRCTLAGVVAGADQGASRAAALRGITSTPAALLDRADVGSLRVGGRADLVLVDTDPVAAPVDQLATAAVTETWVGGELAWSQEGRA